MKKIKQGDEVAVLIGKDKGRRGTVLEVLDNNKVLVEGINVVKKHTKANPNAGVEGGIIDKTMPIDISNVMIWNPEKNRADRVGFKIDKDGKKARIFRSTGAVVDL
ncbi:MAG: 50S ribosomal protein L24 [Woeseiaceae bacterium]|jgi:large subunit ribosomal protein L24|nr:50S ribosomal protein L24 [Woeseiaceae bacterium]|tara:strand:- start:597 stop:914 length:318 start_codon:yes stop_codon:yes gene_type:complete